MKKKKFIPTQIAKIIKEFDLGKYEETQSIVHGVRYRQSLPKFLGFFDSSFRPSLDYRCHG
jgi:hypothetical protein